MSNIVQLPLGHSRLSTMDERAELLSKNPLDLLKPMEALVEHLRTLDLVLVKVQITAEGLNDRPQAGALRQGVAPIRRQLSQLATSLAQAIEEVGGPGWTRR